MSVLTSLHGYYKTPVYNLWRDIIKRCEDRNCSRYQWYGGRGIKMQDIWRKDPKAFCEWALSNGYAKGKEIDRIDVDGDYGPDNCQFITHKENCAPNKRRVRCTSKSGERNVYQTRHGTYEAWAFVDSKQRYVGTFKTKNEATRARDAAEISNIHDTEDTPCPEDT